MNDTLRRPPRIGIIGAGPSGCFLAGTLRRLLPEAEITVIDRMPCPFGLVRYGVAPDHQGTKNIARQFHRIFTRERVGFAGNVTVGLTPGTCDVTLEEVSRRADAVVLATGLAADRPLTIPGADLPGVVGAGVLTRVLNSHPDESSSRAIVTQLGERTAIIGMGNVAIDVVRFLAKRNQDYDGSDINDLALGSYQDSPVASVDVFSRSGIEDAKCDAAMIRELGQISGLRATLHGAPPMCAEDVEGRLQRARVEAFLELEASTSGTEPRIELRMHFGAVPEEVVGEDRVSGLRVVNASGESAVHRVDSIISAIGFEADGHSLEVPECGIDSGRIEPGLYRVGWFRRGPQGTIPDNRADALAVAAEIIADLEGVHAVRADIGAGESFLPQKVAASAIDYDQWLRIDLHERENAMEGRVRNKLSQVAQMLEVARGGGPHAQHENSQTVPKGVFT